MAAGPQQRLRLPPQSVSTAYPHVGAACDSVTKESKWIQGSTPAGQIAIPSWSRECYASNIPFLPEVRSFLANCMLRLVYPHKCGGWNLNPYRTARGYRLQIFAVRRYVSNSCS
jgi:hypothetical protein